MFSDDFEGQRITPIERLLVANRGEIAVRIFRTARELGATCIGVYSDADADAFHVREADLSVHLRGSSSAETYLNIDAILDAAQRAEADAIHPGYGFLAENADFAQAVIDAGLIWVGPRPDTIRQMADKVRAKQLAEAAGVPLVPGAEIGDGAGPQELERTAAEVGYPLMIKAAAGGGGKGMRTVTAPADLVAACEGARREAASAFGDGTIFFERFLPRARHVEVQVFGDGHGGMVHLFERECSIQRRHQKVIEEAPSPGATEVTRERMFTAALSLAERIDYVGAGTVEFLVDGDGEQQQFYFLEMNTRLQVEHRVTELITGSDLVQWQLLVAMGVAFSLTQADIEVDGHAIEARLYAEDPAQDYLPTAGRLELFEISDYECLVDAGYQSGDTVPPYYDPMLAKVIARGDDREAAAEDLAATLATAAITGVTSNRELLVAVLRSLAFSVGDTTTAMLDEHPNIVAEYEAEQPGTDPLYLLVAALEVLGRNTIAPVESDAVPLRWRNVRGTRGFVGLHHGSSETAWVLLEQDSDGLWDLDVVIGDEPYGQDNELIEVGAVRVHRVPAIQSETPLVLAEYRGLTYRFSVMRTLTDGILVDGFAGPVELSAVDVTHSAAAEAAEGGAVSPVPGTVTAVLVGAGEAVSAGQPLVILEAMKMEHTITAAAAATVQDVGVVVGQAVEAHQSLLTLAEVEVGSDD